MPNCYFLIGPMGCGKSTWCERMLPTLDEPVVVSTDAQFEKWAKRDGITYAEAFAKYGFGDAIKDCNAQIARAVIAKRNIILDQTNCSVEDRRMFVKHIPASYTRIGVQFEFDTEVCISRVIERGKRTGKEVPIWAVLNKIKAYVPCQPGEFDEVIVVSRALD